MTNEKFDPTTIAQMANSKPQGKRPNYFNDAMGEQSFAITMSLMAELAAARERANTLERLLVSKGVLSEGEINNYVPDEAAAQERQTAQVEYSSRVFRSLQQQVEAMQEKGSLSMDEMAEKLGK